MRTSRNLEVVAGEPAWRAGREPPRYLKSVEWLKDKLVAPGGGLTCTGLCAIFVGVPVLGFLGLYVVPPPVGWLLLLPAVLMTLAAIVTWIAQLTGASHPRR
jgi:hypothetical protein